MLICCVQFAAPTNQGAQLLSRDIMNNIVIKVTLRNERIWVLKTLVSDVRYSCQSVMIADKNFKNAQARSWPGGFRGPGLLYNLRVYFYELCEFVHFLWVSGSGDMTIVHRPEI